MPDPREGSETREESEEGRRRTGRKREPLALLHPVASGELIADHEWTSPGRVHDRDPRLKLPRAAEERRQINPGLPLDLGGKRLREQHVVHSTGRIGETEFRAAVVHVVFVVE